MEKRCGQGPQRFLLARQVMLRCINYGLFMLLRGEKKRFKLTESQ
tara:strand:+ start:3220 stop:3354 length:135 start_codon:yes stop_codon:yes gene_type:complete